MTNMSEGDKGMAMAVAINSKGASPDPVAVLRGHRAAVNVVEFHSASGTLISGDADGELKIWDLARHRPLFSSRVHNPSAGVLGISCNSSLENKIISQGRDGTVKCWQLTESSLSRQPLLVIKSESYHFCKLSVARHASIDVEVGGNLETAATRSGRTLMAVTGNDTSKVEIWDINSGKSMQLFSPDNSSVGMCMSLHLVPQAEDDDLLTVIAGYEDGSMLVWDTRHLAAPLMQTKQHTEPVLSLAIDRAALGGVSGSADGQVVFFSFDRTKNVCLPKKKFDGRAGVGDITLRCDDKLVATAGWDHKVRIYDYRRRKPLAVLKYHNDLVNSVAFSEDRKMLASTSRDSTIALWSIYPPSEETHKLLQ